MKLYQLLELIKDCDPNTELILVDTDTYELLVPEIFVDVDGINIKGDYSNVWNKEL